MQVAIVTGATGGIGFGCAAKLADMGMAVLATGRNETRLAELAAAIGDPERFATLVVDLINEEPPKRIVNITSTFAVVGVFAAGPTPQPKAA